MAVVKRAFPSLKRGEKWVKDNLHTPKNLKRLIQRDFGGGRWVLYYETKDLKNGMDKLIANLPI